MNKTEKIKRKITRNVFLNGKKTDDMEFIEKIKIIIKLKWKKFNRKLKKFNKIFLKIKKLKEK